MADDLQAQLESLLDVVWKCEREWSFDDRIALAVRSMAAARVECWLPGPAASSKVDAAKW